MTYLPLLKTGHLARDLFTAQAEQLRAQPYLLDLRIYDTEVQFDYPGTELYRQNETAKTCTVYPVQPLTVRILDPKPGYRHYQVGIYFTDRPRFEGTRAYPHPHLFSEFGHCLNGWANPLQRHWEREELVQFCQTWWLFFNHYNNTAYLADYCRSGHPTHLQPLQPLVNPARRTYHRDAYGRFAPRAATPLEVAA